LQGTRASSKITHTKNTSELAEAPSAIFLFNTMQIHKHFFSPIPPSPTVVGVVGAAALAVARGGGAGAGAGTGFACSGTTITCGPSPPLPLLSFFFLSAAGVYQS